MAEIPPNSLFSALAFVGFLLAGLPLPWHVHCKLHLSDVSSFADSILYSMAYGYLHVHALDKPWMLHFVRQLRGMER